MESFHQLRPIERDLDPHLHECILDLEDRFDSSQQRIQVKTRLRRDRHRVLWSADLGGSLGQMVQFVHAQAVDLVQREDHRSVIGTKVFQRGHHRLHLLGRIRMRDIHNVTEHGRFTDFFQRRPECRDELRRQVVDEPHRVGQQHFAPAWQPDSPRGWVERGEELVFRQHVGTSDLVEQRALPGIRVPDEGDDRNRRLLATGAIGLPMPMHLGQLVLQEADSLLCFASVGFKLGLTRTAQADSATTGLARKVSPHPGQAWKPVFQLGEFNLQASLVRLCPAGEDVENQRRAVDHQHVELSLEIPLLRGCQVTVDHDQVITKVLAEVPDLFELALADIGARVRMGQLLGNRAHHLDVDRLGKPGEFLQ